MGLQGKQPTELNVVAVERAWAPTASAFANANTLCSNLQRPQTSAVITDAGEEQPQQHQQPLVTRTSQLKT
jgi:hypothetical protein